MSAITELSTHHHHKSDEGPQSPAVSPTSTPKIYLIRHGEKPPKLPTGDDAPGLSTLGITRSQGLISVFDPTSIYNVKYIIAQHPHKHEKEARPYETILPLSQSLAIVPDIDVERDDAAGAAQLCLQLASQKQGNVLLCWEHGVLGKIVAALGVTETVVYPGDRYDVIWCVWDKLGDGNMVLEWVGSEGVPGLDEKWIGNSGAPGVGLGPVLVPNLGSSGDSDGKLGSVDVSVAEVSV